MIETSTTHKCNVCNERYTQVINNKYCRFTCDMCLISEIVDLHKPSIYVQQEGTALDTYNNCTDNEYNGISTVYNITTF